MKYIPVQNINRGGISDSDFSTTQENAVAEMVGLDVHSTPGQIKVRQKLTKITAENVPTEFCKAAVVSSNGRDYWFSSESGKIWENNAGTWTLKYTAAPKNGAVVALDAMEHDGWVYWSTQNFIHRIKVSKLSGTWDSTTVEMNWADLTLDQELIRKAPVAMRFDGVDDYLSQSTAALTHSDTVTFSCWFYAEEDSSDTNIQTIWSGNDVSGVMRVELGGDTTSVPNRNRVAVYGGTTLLAQTDSNAFVSGQWNHLVFTRSGAGTGNYKIYINGVLRTLITDVATSFANTTAIKYIGIRSTTTLNAFTGLLADIRIQSVAISAAEALSLYEGESVEVASTIAYYPLNNTIRDLGASNHNTLNGNPTFFYITDFEIPFHTVLANALSEIDTDKKFFTANSETLTYLKLWVADKGASNITVTIHDSTNTIIGSAVTITNGNLVVGWNYFTMNLTGLNYGETYHLHIHSSGTDSYLKSNNYNDIADSFIKLLSTADSEYHPMEIQNNVLFIGDRNYIHQVDKNVSTGEHIFTARALDFNYPHRASCLGKFETDLLIGTKVDSRIAKAMVIRWNTWSESYSVTDDIPEEGINAFIDADNYVEVSAGLTGSIYFYNGKDLEIMRQAKGDYDAGGKVTVNPNATANFKGLPLIGFSNVSGNPIMQGVYSFGNKNSNYPVIMGFDFPISQRSTGALVTSNIEIGAIVIAGNDMFVSWRDSNASPVSGIDKLDYTAKLENAYFTTMYLDPSQIFINNYHQYMVKYTSLPTNTGIQLEYSINYEAFVAFSNELTDTLKKQVSSNSVLQAVPLQIRVKFTVSNNDAPKITALIISANDNG